MHRDVDLLTERTFDVLVVGGGVYGLTIAYDAAQRGLAVALIEADDFGSGASFNHLRTIHGGLRYLQTFDISRARESVRERRTLARIAPHAVQPLRVRAAADAIAHQGQAGDARRLSARSPRLRRPQSRRAGGAPPPRRTRRVARHGDSALSRPAPARADRRRGLVRLRNDRGRSPDVHVGDRRGRARRGTGESRRGDRAAAGWAPRGRRARPRSADRTRARDRRPRDRQRHRRRRGSPADPAQPLGQGAAAQGDEPRHAPRGRRRSARRPFDVGPQSVSGAVARLRALRHVGVRADVRARCHGRQRGGDRRVHRRFESGVSLARPEARRRHDGASRDCAGGRVR